MQDAACIPVKCHGLWFTLQSVMNDIGCCCAISHPKYYVSISGNHFFSSWLCKANQSQHNNSWDVSETLLSAGPICGVSNMAASRLGVHKCSFQLKESDRGCRTILTSPWKFLRIAVDHLFPVQAISSFHPLQEANRISKDPTPPPRTAEIFLIGATIVNHGHEQLW